MAESTGIYIGHLRQVQGEHYICARTYIYTFIYTSAYINIYMAESTSIYIGHLWQVQGTHYICASAHICTYMYMNVYIHVYARWYKYIYRAPAASTSNTIYMRTRYICAQESSQSAKRALCTITDFCKMMGMLLAAYAAKGVTIDEWFILGATVAAQRMT